MNATRDQAIQEVLTARPNWLGERVLPRIAGLSDPESCWVWQGGMNRAGYGIAMLPRAITGHCSVLVHRVMWLAVVGPVDPELVLDHDGPSGCSNRACCNPAHLQAVTTWVNIAVTGKRGLLSRTRGGRSVCPAGHTIDGDNLFARGNRKVCRTCWRQRDSVRYSLITDAAHHLGMSRDAYIAEYGRGKAAAIRTLSSPIA